jgi:hypothetical protein
LRPRIAADDVCRTRRLARCDGTVKVGVGRANYQPRQDRRERKTPCPLLVVHVDLPFHNDVEIGVVEHVFASDTAQTLEEFRARLYSSDFDARRLLLESRFVSAPPDTGSKLTP